jgi:ssDNA-specific exonuclease RecJ
VKDQCSILCSQQTAATVNESVIRPKLAKFMEKPISMNAISQAFEEQEQSTIYKKNGWMKRVNTLTTENLRETIQSEYEGQDTFSEDYLLAGQNLGALGSMGKQLKGSITGP